jgi:hypothetical protein
MPLMQRTRSNGARQAVKDLDPDRRPTPPLTGFWPLPEAHPLVVCGRCCAAIPATERAQRGHRQFHEQVDGHDAR